jgi:hypothetical protein
VPSSKVAAVEIWSKLLAVTKAWRSDRCRGLLSAACLTKRRPGVRSEARQGYSQTGSSVSKPTCFYTQLTGSSWLGKADGRSLPETSGTVGGDTVDGSRGAKRGCTLRETSINKSEIYPPEPISVPVHIHASSDQNCSTGGDVWRRTDGE